MIQPTPYKLVGGIHPDEQKQLSNHIAPRKLPLAESLHFPLETGPYGLQAKVQDGERVLGGQCIARGNGPFSQAWHAPTSGRIEWVAEMATADAQASTCEGLRLIPDGSDNWVAPEPELSEHSEPDELLDRIAWAGIAGMGGAGFPTHAKLAGDQQVQTLIINIAECEPYISCDDVITRTESARILEGARIIMRILNATRLWIGIEDNKPEATAAMEQALAAQPDLDATIWVCPTKYPSGGEKQLIQLITGEEIPAGQRPAALGYHMHNPATLVAVADAVLRGRPLTHRLVTLTGQAAQDPGNRWTALGTPIQHCIDQATGKIAAPARTIMGGPMMGFEVLNTSAGVLKTTNCLLLAGASEIPAVPAEQPCIRCGECAVACPVALQPQTLFWQIQGQDMERAQAEGLMDCIECGACAYVCPSHIPLVSYYRHGKDTLRQRQLDQVKSDRARTRFEARQARLEAEQAARAAKRAARAKQIEQAQQGEDPRKAAVQAALERTRKKREASE